MKKSKVAALAMVLLLPMAGCTAEETSSPSQPSDDLVLNENQGIRMIKDSSTSEDGIRYNYKFSTYFDINFDLTHQVNDKTVLDFPYKFTTISIELPSQFEYRGFENHINRQIGTLYHGILKIDFEFPDYIYDFCGFTKDNEGNWIPGPIELLTSCYPNDDGTYINNPSLYQDVEIASGGAGNNYEYPTFFFEVYEL